jgi:hypothetical protein
VFSCIFAYKLCSMDNCSRKLRIFDFKAKVLEPQPMIIIFSCTSRKVYIPMVPFSGTFYISHRQPSLHPSHKHKENAGYKSICVAPRLWRYPSRRSEGPRDHGIYSYHALGPLLLYAKARTAEPYVPASAVVIGA